MIKNFKTLAIIIISFAYLPIAVLAINSFNISRSGSSWEGFTLNWYLCLLSDTYLIESVKKSLVIATASSLFSTALATMSAIALNLTSKDRKFLKIIHKAILKILILIPEIQIGIGIMLFFIFMKIDFGITTMILAHTAFCTVYIFNVINARLEKFDLTIIEAAKDLGANSKDIMFQIIIPMSIQSIIATAMLAFTLSMEDFLISFLVAGYDLSTVPMETYNKIKLGFPAIVCSISTIMMLFMFITSYLFTKMTFTKNENCPR